jgi:proteasome assembly chaperone (PAC2) family protein
MRKKDDRGTRLSDRDRNSFSYLHKVADVKIKGPAIVIQGLPGMGLIGKIAANFLIEEFEGEEIARIYSSFFPPVVQIDNEQGIGRLARMEMYAITKTTPNLIILTGDAQPHDIGIIQVLNEVLDYVIKQNAGTVVCLGGLRALDEGPEVAGFAYDEETMKWLEKHEIVPLKGGEITGAVGVFSALAAERGLRSVGLLGKLTLVGTDPLASKNLLKRLGMLFSLKFTYEGLEEIIQEAIAKNELLHKTEEEELAAATEKNSGPSYYI